MKVSRFEDFPVKYFHALLNERGTEVVSLVVF
jgi:hypothetical protein